MPISQATIPKDFNNLWRVGGWFDEHEHAQRMCRVLGYEQDDDGTDLVRVSFVDREVVCDAQEALIHAQMLFPA